MLHLAYDARDAIAAQRRGWGRYASSLLRSLERRDDVHVQRIDRGWPGPESAFEAFGLARAARGADVLHVPNCFLPTRRRPAGVVTIHDLAFEDHPQDFARTTALKYRAWTPRAAASADAIITPSAFTRDDIVRRYRIDPQKIHVIGEAPTLRLTDAPPPEGPYLLAVGDLRKKKNFPLLAAAFRQLRKAGLPHRLIIVGLDAGEAATIRAAAEREPIELPGYVDDRKLDALMRGADALVHPSIYEGYGLVLVEAMARGVPVAAADATATPETLGGAGALFDPHDVSALCDAVSKVLDNREHYAALGRARAAQLSWDRVAEQTVAVYRQVARA